MLASINSNSSGRGVTLLATRLAVVQTLYSNSISAQLNTQKFAWLDDEQYQEVDHEFYVKLINLVAEYDAAIMTILLPALQQRKWENIDLVLQKNISLCLRRNIWEIE